MYGGHERCRHVAGLGSGMVATAFAPVLAAALVTSAERVNGGLAMPRIRW